VVGRIRSIKDPVFPLGMITETFRLVAQLLNQLRYRVSPTKNYTIKFSVLCIIYFALYSDMLRNWQDMHDRNVTKHVQSFKEICQFIH
jgi:hypothetical protein